MDHNECCDVATSPVQCCRKQILCCQLMSSYHSITHLSLKGSLVIKPSEAVVICVSAQKPLEATKSDTKLLSVETTAAAILHLR